MYTVSLNVIIDPGHSWFVIDTGYQRQPLDTFEGYHGTTCVNMVTIMRCGCRALPTPLKLGSGGWGVAFRSADKPTEGMAYASSFGCAAQYAASKKSPVPWVVVMYVVAAHQKRSRVRTDYFLTDAMTTKVYIKPRNPMAPMDPNFVGWLAERQKEERIAELLRTLRH